MVRATACPEDGARACTQKTRRRGERGWRDGTTRHSAQPRPPTPPHLVASPPSAALTRNIPQTHGRASNKPAQLAFFPRPSHRDCSRAHSSAPPENPARQRGERSGASKKSTALEMQTPRPQPRRPPCRPSLYASLAPARTSGTRAGGHSAPGHRMDKLVSSSSVCPSRLSRKKNDGPIVPWRAATGWSTRSTDRDGKAMCTL